MYGSAVDSIERLSTVNGHGSSPLIATVLCRVPVSLNEASGAEEDLELPTSRQHALEVEASTGLRSLYARRGRHRPGLEDLRVVSAPVDGMERVDGVGRA